ncbi:MAG: hypothetical protein ACM359_01850 [Bacillota bacterium]
MLPAKRPPCDRLAADHPRQCPKYRLCPEGNGLHPKNRLALQMYVLASRDIRAGMDGCLIGTLTPSDAKAVLDLYVEHMPTPLARQRTFELMILLDQVITAKRAEKESAINRAALTAARQKGKNRRT